MYIKHFTTAAAMLLLAASANATTVSSVAVADDWFRANDTYTTFQLSGNPTDLFLRTFGAAGLNRSALEFSLANIAPNSLIQSATFSVQSGGTALSGANFNFYGYSGDGIIKVADATQTGNLLASKAIQSGTPRYTVDATALIQSLVNANASFAGFLITVSQQDAFVGNDLCSRESAGQYHYCTAADLPTLTVNYTAAAVPEPGNMALFGIALAGFGAAYRRRQVK